MLTKRLIPLVRMVKREFSKLSNKESLAMSLENCNYNEWSKEDLIKKIEKLEGQDKGNSIVTTNDGQDIPKKKQKKQFDFLKYHKRFIALKFGYLGWNYNGLAFQYEPTPLPTVEETILQAMAKAKLISSADPDSCKFSRCGRTDKGVSAMSQVISLVVRSNFDEEDQKNPENDDKEVAYITILNSILPTDIRITAVCLRPPPDFDARFSCLYRHYRYLFKKTDLDIEAMQQAAKYYEGVHDFRNFCKIDGSKQITNFNRQIHLAKIIHLKDDFFYFDLKGSAFLWHQVRCMVAVLFLIGQKLESPTLVQQLLDVNNLPSKPNYEMANDIPLVLYDCAFPPMEWLEPNDFSKHKMEKDSSLFKGLLLDYQLKANIAEILDSFFIKHRKEPLLTKNGGAVNTGNGRGRYFKTYTPVIQRQVGDTFEVVNERHRQKLLKKKNEKKNVDNGTANSSH